MEPPRRAPFLCSIALPVAPRYAWVSDPGDVNPRNEAGLPAAPFRTEDTGDTGDTGDAGDRER